MPWIYIFFCRSHNTMARFIICLLWIFCRHWRESSGKFSKHGMFHGIGKLLYLSWCLTWWGDFSQLHQIYPRIEILFFSIHVCSPFSYWVTTYVSPTYDTIPSFPSFSSSLFVNSRHNLFYWLIRLIFLSIPKSQFMDRPCCLLIIALVDHQDGLTELLPTNHPRDLKWK